jgi:AAA15 family ATPase/GTPase
MLDKLWEIVLDVSRKLNVQVFATTHSKEGIESYSRVSKKLEDEDIVFIELGKDKNNLLKSIVMDNNRFYRELENGNGVRGW